MAVFTAIAAVVTAVAGAIGAVGAGAAALVGVTGLATTTTLVIGGAIIGGVVGGVTAAVQGENIFEGILKGGLIGAAAGGALGLANTWAAGVLAEEGAAAGASIATAGEGVAAEGAAMSTEAGIEGIGMTVVEEGAALAPIGQEVAKEGFLASMSTTDKLLAAKFGADALTAFTTPDPREIAEAEKRDMRSTPGEGTFRKPVFENKFTYEDIYGRVPGETFNRNQRFSTDNVYQIQNDPANAKVVAAPQSKTAQPKQAQPGMLQKPVGT